MVYIHIPFCRSHCTYCGFYSELLRRDNPSLTQKFVDALLREIEDAKTSGQLQLFLPALGNGRTLYIGGGTPSVLDISQLECILKALDASPRFDEFTVEVNPDDILRGGLEYAAGLRSLGVNRISMGVQSFDDKVLRRMGRRHTASEAVEAFGLLRKAGFDNISADLIFGFDSQMSVHDIKQGLEILAGSTGIAGFPEHISCYQLSIEPGSGLEKMVERGIYAMPSDELCEKQYYDICALLQNLGYEHYEISNWAKPGYRSRHNSGYWNHTPYLGFGPGAHSLLVDAGTSESELGYVRRWNEPDLEGYVSWGRIPRGSEILTAEQYREEKIMLGLRTCEGVPVGLIDDEPVAKALQSGDLERVPADLCRYESGRTPEGRLRIPESRWFVSDAIIASLV